MNQKEKEKYENNAKIYAVLANQKRLAILNTIGKKEMSVEELVKRIKISKPNMSQHLARLRHLRLVKTRREGLRIYYRLTYPAIIKACDILYKFNKNYRVK